MIDNSNINTHTEDLRKVITTKNSKMLRSIMERYGKEIRNYKPSKMKSGLKYIGIPIERAEEIMGGIITEGVGATYPKGDIGWMEKCKEGLEVLKGGVAA